MPLSSPPPSPPLSPRSIFEQEVPAAFLDGLPRLGREVYTEALEHALDMGYRAAQLHDHLAQIRRGIFERRLEDLARDHGLRCETRMNARQTSSHLVVIAGRVALTQSYVRTPWGHVRRAKFRNTYAETLDMFMTEEELQALEDAACAAAAEVYGIVLHSCEPTDPGVMTFIGVGFPRADQEGWVERCDLTRRLVVSRRRRKTVEAVEAEVVVRRERKIVEVPPVSIKTRPGRSKKKQKDDGTTS